MPITRLTTWAAGNILTAADLNAEFNNITTQTARLTGAETITGAWTFSTDPVLNNNAVPWAKVSKTGSSLADLITRSAADLSGGSLSLARIAPGTDGQVLKTVSGGTAWDTGIRVLFGPWVKPTAHTAGLTDAVMNYLPAGTSSADFRSVIAPQPGSVTGLVYAFCDACPNTLTAGSISYTVQKNAVGVWAATSLTSASALQGTVNQAVGADTFVAGDRIRPVLSTSGTYTHSADPLIGIWIELSL